MNKKREIAFIIYGCCLSSVIALVSYLFLMIEKTGSHFIWESLGKQVGYPVIYKAVAIGFGAVIVYILKKKWGALPKDSHEVMDELKENQIVDYSRTFHSLIMALLILILGAGVGPEAPLLAAIIAFSIWQADKLRFLKFYADDFERLKFSQKVTWLIHPKKYLKSYSEENNVSKFKKIFFGINGVIVFFILMNMTEQPSFITKLGDSNWSKSELLVFIPLMMYSFFLGKIYLYIVDKAKRFLSNFKFSLLHKTVFGAVAIFLISVFTPYLLFSGQHSMHLVLELGLEVSVYALLALSVLKLVFLDICMGTGWRGGDIFPVVFASILHGYALAQLLPNYDVLFVVLVVSMTMAASILKKEYIVVIFISLFFPLKLIPIAIIVLVILLLVNRIIARRRG